MMGFDRKIYEDSEIRCVMFQKYNSKKEIREDSIFLLNVFPNFSFFQFIFYIYVQQNFCNSFYKYNYLNSVNYSSRLSILLNLLFK